MSSTADRSAEDQTYFQRIEEAFIRLRGAPLLLSPADWRVAQEWRQQGVPLALVVATLEEVFAARAARGGRGRVNSLRYVAPAVEAAWERARELLASGAAVESAAGPSTEERLARLADALPEALPRRARWADVIRSLEGTPEAVETRLAEVEAELQAALRAELDPATTAELEREVDEAVSRAGARIAAEEWRRLRRQLEGRALRRRFDLPVLSLFTLDE